MTKKEIIIIADYTQQDALTLEELCDICHISPTDAIAFIDHDIIHPKTAAEQGLFDAVQLHRLQKALRLQHDLEVNLQGIALLLDLLDELESLRALRK